MTIPFKVKLLTSTAKPPHRNCESDLWDLFADDFKSIHPNDLNYGSFIFDSGNEAQINPQSRILIKTGISLHLPILWSYEYNDCFDEKWLFEKDNLKCNEEIAYAVADIRPRSGLALKHGITVLNTPGTIDNSYRKEIGVILYNAGHEPYTISKGDKICQMLVRPLYPSRMEIVEDIKDTGRGAYGSTGK